MPVPKTNAAAVKRTRRRADTLLLFDPGQKVPDSVLDLIIEAWLVPSLVEQFLRDRGITQQSLSIRYRTLE